MKQGITIPIWLAVLLVGGLLSLETWMLKEITELKVQVASVGVKVSMHIEQTSQLQARKQ